MREAPRRLNPAVRGTIEEGKASAPAYACLLSTARAKRIGTAHPKRRGDTGVIRSSSRRCDRQDLLASIPPDQTPAPPGRPPAGRTRRPRPTASARPAVEPEGSDQTHHLSRARAGPRRTIGRRPARASYEGDREVDIAARPPRPPWLAPPSPPRGDTPRSIELFTTPDQMAPRRARPAKGAPLRAPCPPSFVRGRHSHAALNQVPRRAGGAPRAGVPIVRWTDQGVQRPRLHRELELYVQAGLSPWRRSVRQPRPRPRHDEGRDRGRRARKRADFIVSDATL